MAAYRHFVIVVETWRRHTSVCLDTIRKAFSKVSLQLIGPLFLLTTFLPLCTVLHANEINFRPWKKNSLVLRRVRVSKIRAGQTFLFQVLRCYKIA